jgi:uncharacterized spore protein YtfJ
MFVNTMTNVAVQIVLLQTLDCVGLLSIREIIKTSKTSTLIDNIEQNLADIKNNIDKITENRQQNMSEIRQNKGNNKITELRTILQRERQSS